MSTRTDDTLDRDLHERAVQVARPVRQADLVARCLDLARATRVNERAWALVRLAADLRALGDHRRALYVLDTAWFLLPEDEAVRAIETVAIACHCDMGAHLTAVRIEQQPGSLPPDLKRARAAVRLYAELFEATGEDDYRIRREFFSMLISELNEMDTTAAVTQV